MILVYQGKGFRGIEAFIAVMVGIIAGSYLIETIFAQPDWGQVLFHTFVPSLPGSEAVLLSVGIIGATVMPHVIYLHSSLTQSRIVGVTDDEKRRIYGFERVDVVLAMGVAGLINMAMLFMAARVFNFTGHTEVADINTAYLTLTPLLGGAASLVFAISLLASGIASSHVGTMAGQVVMQGFVNFGIPVWMRRIMTMVPALVVIGLGIDPTRTLILSQVVLSFTLPIPVITLIIFTKNPRIMGALVNRRLTTVLAMACAVTILLLNALLVYQTLGGQLPSVG
jgi:manganese transport protein